PLIIPNHGISQMADGEDGALLIGMVGGVGQFADGKLQVAHPFPVAMRELFTLKMLVDRDGGLWVGTAGGIIHVHQGHTDVFSQPDGLTGDYVSSLFEDREGNVWAATLNGLDRFREFPITTYSVSQGLSSRRISVVLGTKEGEIWIGTADG